jgi:hypothetical protein
MKKKRWDKRLLLLVILAICLLAAGVLLGAWQAWRTRNTWIPLFTAMLAPRVAAQSATSTPDTPPPTPYPPLVIATRLASEESKSPRYTIQGKWPVLEWPGDTRGDAFNRAVERMVNDEISGFKNGISQLPDEPGIDETGSSLSFDYITTNSNNGILSVLVRISFYTAGAAHPGHYSRAINYNLREGKVLALQDLFTSGADFLDPISAACLKDLKARGVLGWEDGALPKADNYQVWNITPAGLQIIFDEYQVAPYASGPQAVTIPYEVLKDLIRPEGPLVELLHAGK